MLNRIKSCNISQYSQHIEEFENLEVGLYPKDAKLAITRIHTDLLNLILVSIVPTGKKMWKTFHWQKVNEKSFAVFRSYPFPDHGPIFQSAIITE